MRKLDIKQLLPQLPGQTQLVDEEEADTYVRMYTYVHVVIYVCICVCKYVGFHTECRGT